MAQFRAQPETDYLNATTGQRVRYTAAQLQDPAMGFLSDQFQPSTPSPTTSVNAPAPAPATISAPTVAPIAPVQSPPQSVPAAQPIIPSVPTSTSTYSGPSIVDYLRSVGQANDFASRSQLAAQNGIQNYTGTAQQNTQLLSTLRGGSSNPIAPTQQPTASPAPSTPTTPQSDTSAPTATPEVVTQPDLGTQVDNILAKYGITPPTNTAENPITSFADVYKQVYESLGLTDIKSEFEKTQTEYSDLQNELNDQVAQVNENPWITEGVRRDKINALQERYQGKLSNLLNKQNHLESLFSAGRSEAQFVTQMGLQQQNRSQDLNRDFVLKAIDLAEKQSITTQDAKNNWQDIANEVTSGGLNYADLSPEQQQKISQLEVQAGLPLGFTSRLQNKNPKADVLSVTTRQDTTGDKYADVLTRDPSTGALKVVSQYIGPARVGRGSTGSSGSSNRGAVLSSNEKALLSSYPAGFTTWWKNQTADFRSSGTAQSIADEYTRWKSTKVANELGISDVPLSAQEVISTALTPSEQKKFVAAFHAAQAANPKLDILKYLDSWAKEQETLGYSPEKLNTFA